MTASRLGGLLLASRTAPPLDQTLLLVAFDVAFDLAVLFRLTAPGVCRKRAGQELSEEAPEAWRNGGDKLRGSSLQEGLKCGKIDQIDLVEEEEARPVPQSDLVENILDDLDVAEYVGVVNVGDMKQKIGPLELLA